MKENMLEEMETDVNSPDKQPAETVSNCYHAKNYLIHAHPTQTSSRHLSRTEKEIYSREIVRQVLKASHHKTIKHDINNVHHETILYAQPKPKVINEFTFSSIPPKNKLYSSVCSAKIHHISRAFSEKKNSAQCSSKCTKNQMKDKLGRESQSNSQITKKANVSVSGLVTYKFNSVNAQRSLGFNQIDYVQNMQSELAMLKTNRECSRIRQKIILSKGGKRKYDRYIQTEKAIMNNFSASTDDYLRDLMREKQQNQMIYNEKANKLRFIKELMQEDKMNYDDAKHIVQKIEDIHAESEVKSRVTTSTELNEEQELNKRRVSSKQNRVFLRYINFVD